MAENKKVVITLVKSPIGGKENQKIGRAHV